MTSPAPQTFCFPLNLLYCLFISPGTDCFCFNLWTPCDFIYTEKFLFSVFRILLQPLKPFLGPLGCGHLGFKSLWALGFQVPGTNNQLIMGLSLGTTPELVLEPHGQKTLYAVAWTVFFKVLELRNPREVPWPQGQKWFPNFRVPMCKGCQKTTCATGLHTWFLMILVCTDPRTREPFPNARVYVAGMCQVPFSAAAGQGSQPARS